MKHFKETPEQYNRALIDVMAGKTLTFDGTEFSINSAREEMRAYYVQNVYLEKTLFEDRETSAGLVYHALLRSVVRNQLKQMFDDYECLPSEFELMEQAQ